MRSHQRFFLTTSRGPARPSSALPCPAPLPSALPPFLCSSSNALAPRCFRSSTPPQQRTPTPHGHGFHKLPSERGEKGREGKLHRGEMAERLTQEEIDQCKEPRRCSTSTTTGMVRACVGFTHRGVFPKTLAGFSRFALVAAGSGWGSPSCSCASHLLVVC